MKKKYSVLMLIIAFVLMLPSCSSVYSEMTDVEESHSMEINVEEEYFTTGSVYKTGHANYGFLYDGYWIYTEKQAYEALVNVKKDGTKVYMTKTAERLVKVNAATGTVSSLCLDPVCNHSPGSECIMMAPEGGNIYISDVVGDWIMFQSFRIDDVYGGVYKSIAYNLKTGESDEIFKYDLGETQITRWYGHSVFDNKLYSVRNTLDYSGTDYVPGGDKPFSDFVPETLSYLCVYDFDDKTTKDLFEIPQGYGIASVTNQSIYLLSPEGDIYSCDPDGGNMIKEDVFDFAPENKIGTYAFVFTDNGFERYDIKANTKIAVESDVVFYQKPLLTDSGILYNTFTTIIEWEESVKGFAEFMKEHPEMTREELIAVYTRTNNEILYSGSAQVWITDFDGNNKELLFEKPNSRIQLICATGDYAYAYVTFPDLANDYGEMPYINEGRSYINLKTGEITSIPYLDLIVTD